MNIMAINAPGYLGAENHVFVIQHVREDRYVLSVDFNRFDYKWTHLIRRAHVFSYEEAKETNLPDEGRWYAIGRRIYLDTSDA